MPAWLAVAVGGAVGAVARHAVSRIVVQQWPAAKFPWATLAVNISGCLVIGLLAGLIASGAIQMRATWREFVFVGILGGFTTFSTFGLDTMTLLRAGDPAGAFWNVALQVGAGLGAVYVGMKLAA